MMAILRGLQQKTSNLFLQMWFEHFCEAHPLQVVSFPILIFLFLGRYATTQLALQLHQERRFFSSTHCRVLPVWVEESWSVRKLGHASILAVKSHSMMNISTNSFQITKSFRWLLNNFVRSSLNFQICLQQSNLRITSGAKSTFGPVWVRTGPENLKNLIGILPAVALNWSKVTAKDFRKLH